MGELSELSPDHQNSCVSSCSQTDVEQFSAEACSRRDELSLEEPTGALEDGSPTLVEIPECDMGKNDANTSSPRGPSFASDGTNGPDCNQNSEGLGQNKDISHKVGVTPLTDCGKNIEHIEMDVENPPGRMLTTECVDTLCEGCEDQGLMDVENPSEKGVTPLTDCGKNVEMDAGNTSGEMLTTSTGRGEIFYEGCEDQVQMDVEMTVVEIQNVSTEVGENLSIEVPVQIGGENSPGKVQATVSECSETLSNQVQIDVEKIAGEVLTTAVVSSECSENMYNSCENQVQTSSLSEEQSTYPDFVKNVLEGCESQVQMNAESISEEVQTTSTDCNKNLTEGFQNQVLVNVAENGVGGTSERCEKSLGDCEDPFQINVENKSFPESSVEFGLELVKSVEDTSDGANIHTGSEKSPSKDKMDTLSLSNDLALLGLDDTSCVKVNDIIESIDPKDLLLSYDHSPQVQFSAGVPNVSLESNVSSDIDMTLVSDNMLSEILEEEDIDGIFRSTLSSQESDSDCNTSDSDRLFMDCDDVPEREDSGTGILPNEKEASPVEQLGENDQMSISGGRVEKFVVTSERVNLSTNSVDIDKSSTIRGECGDNSIKGKHVFKKVDEPQACEGSAPVSPNNKIGEHQNSELESGAETDGGSGAIKADNLEENGKAEVKIDSDVNKESEGMSRTMTLRNGVLFVPSRMVVKRSVEIKPEVKLDPTPAFDVGSVWQVVKKRAMGMNAKPDN